MTKNWKSKKITASTELALVNNTAGEVDAVLAVSQSLGFVDKSVDDITAGALNALATENGEITERGRNRVRAAIKFVSLLLGGKKHKEALKESGLEWAQVTAFVLSCPAFEQIYNVARKHMKMSMGYNILDTAYEMATEGSDVYYKGEVVGKKKSEKMLDRLLPLAGKEFSKDGGNKKQEVEVQGGGITLNFHFDGKKSQVGEVVDVKV